ncbi:DNA replication complex GINS family protein [Sulfuracidifex metallicus]|uniref:DNA replication complex GINS family protein n=1 Tax=Sulfuracidifex metallicus TaxID=47303 RepID=UPI002272A427|nr:DNA replication complex GINS family protein [Sulfuracidifex metallicus]MCY0849999.1 DNA replication complex GINS family protein [Sulfuracidifex metallicus]
MLLTRINAIRNSSLSNIRKVMVLDEWNRETIHGEVHLAKGSEAELPRWLAEELQKEGIVKIIDSFTIDDLGRILFQEKQRPNVPASITKTDDSLYQKMKELIIDLRNSNNISSLEQMRKAISIAAEISSLRIRKVVQLSLLDIKDEKIMDKMTQEERLIFYSIREILESIKGESYGETA